MGAFCCRARSQAVADILGLPQEEASTRQWHIWPSFDEAKEQFEADPIMPTYQCSSQVELRNLLHEPVAQQALGAFAKKLNRLHLLMCWIDIEEYKSVGSFEHRRLCGLKIVHNYVDKTSPLRIHTAGVDPQQHAQSLLAILVPMQAPPETTHSLSHDSDSGSRTSASSRLDRGLFDAVQKACFLEIYHKLFVPFKTETNYVDLRVGLKKKYNKVRPKDFEFFDLLGEGSYGAVVRCRKKSTGKMYAMKIMHKAVLSDAIGWDHSKMDAEVRALSALQHPLIIGMEYSFQTEKYALIAMELVPGGTIRSLCKTFDGSVLPEKHIRFYAAEITVALHYLHTLGMIYRDMKPANVLLDASGHIKLADLGGLLDYSDGTTLRPISSKRDTTGTSFPFARSYALRDVEEGNCDHLSNPVRRRTVFGTPGYASPEVMALTQPGKRYSKGYSYMADWWSLGVTLFVLCTEQLPFGSADGPHDGYSELTGAVEFPEDKSNISTELQDLVRKFLTVDDTARLGYGLNGLSGIQSHPFFAAVDWMDIVHVRAEPPVIPPAPAPLSSPHDFETVCTTYIPGGESRIMVAQDSEGFDNWDYVSPTTLREEFGISQEMGHLDNELKLKQQNKRQHSVPGVLASVLSVVL